MQRTEIAHNGRNKTKEINWVIQKWRVRNKEDKMNEKTKSDKIKDATLRKLNKRGKNTNKGGKDIDWGIL